MAIYLEGALPSHPVTAVMEQKGRMFSPDIPEDPASGSAGGPLGAFAVKYGLVARGPKVSLISEQGTKMGRPSILHIELTYGESKDVPERSEVGGSVMPVLAGTLSDFEG